ncbi:adenylate cyclase 1 [Kordia sp. SMS9]|uniref:adenylate/guanylate cyclase domain-containing protein n=1 Tax=Kordia sp. SMS9 TaxID=2282170 RepID=UPI000E0D853E|nr:adenylate/guanylate cyclase domain-containing protein [Kordia sp. SMS9]AXG71015.1 adenylate cyclase 1 [Kordia sp. SMS9]
MLSPRLKRYLTQILPFGIIWFLFGLIFLIVEFAATKNYNYLPKGVIEVNLQIFIFAMIAVVFVGFVIGTIEVVFLKRIFAKSTFLKKILGKLAIYSVFLFIIVIIMFPIAVSIELHTSITDAVVWQKLSDYLQSIGFLSTGFQMFISLAASLFYAELSENIGYGVLANFIRGKYHTPKEENRIFMFLDMKSSTAIAEQLGHVTYFKLLKEYYYTLSDAVITHSGEIYQYVGDEMVVSWTYKNGIHNNNCIECFFTMKKDLQAKHAKFQKKFGIQPQFKAGLHLGTVTTGEIGNVKKEIIFTGDVLNATARIQSLCNALEVDILISKELKGTLQLEAKFQVTSLGDNKLRGKIQAKELYTLQKK